MAPRLWPCDDDFRYLDVPADFDSVGGEVRDFPLAAQEWARAHSNVEGARHGGLHAYWARFLSAVEPGPASGPPAAGD